MTEYTAKDVSRFWSKIVRSDDPDSCLSWSGSPDSHGYGQLRWGKNKRLAHRVSYELAYGAFPDAMDVLHVCDNPICCNPRHLRLGTHLDNMRDMAQKGRAVGHVGEDNGNCKTSQDAVVKIRQDYSTGGYTLRDLATRFGLSQTQVSRIVRNESWKQP